MHEELNHTTFTRRRFIGWMSHLLSAVMTVLLAVPLLGFALAPLFERRKKVWLKVAEVAQVKVGEPSKFVYSLRKMEGWLEKVERGTVYVVTQDGVNFTVFSNVCTHAGCGVRWEAGKKVFMCPCHDGKFDLDGKVAGGPPPKSLNRFAHKVEKGALYISLRG